MQLRFFTSNVKENYRRIVHNRKLHEMNASLRREAHMEHLCTKH